MNTKDEYKSSQRCYIGSCGGCDCKFICWVWRGQGFGIRPGVLGEFGLRVQYPFS